MKKIVTTITTMSLAAFLISCDSKDKNTDQNTKPETPNTPAPDDHHEHDEVALGEFTIGEYKVTAAQGHGAIEAGKESGLVIILPYDDKGETVTRAWIGTSDRTMSTVGKGDYAPDHGDYDIHVIAPDPLPAGATWWLEIEKPDGTKAVGSIPFLRDISKE